MHSFSLYINKYINVLFSGIAEFSGNDSVPEADAVCMKKRMTESEKEYREQERERKRTKGSFWIDKGEQHELFCQELL